jgi:hypothetical protein
MNELDKIEKLFSSKLGTYEETPPPAVWEKVSAAISSSAPAKPWYLTKNFFRYAAAILIATTIFSVYFFYSSNELPTNNKLSTINEIQPLKPTVVDSKTETSALNSPINDENVTISLSANFDSSQTEFQQNTTLSEVVTVPAEVIILDKQPVYTEVQTNEVKFAFAAKLMPPVVITSEMHLIIPITDTEIRKDEMAVMPIEKKEEIVVEVAPVVVNIVDSASNNQVPSLPATPIRRTDYPLVLSLNAGMDQIFNSSSEYKRSYTSDMRLTYHTREFFIQSGFGIDHSKEKWQYAYNYRQSEVVGTYTRVDSIYFTQYTDSVGNVYFSPNFVTSDFTVYDSSNYHKETTTSDYYTYVHFPLLAGYSLYSFRGMNVSIKGGPVFNVLVNNKKDKLFDLYGDARLLSVNTNRLSRYTTNWYMMMAFDFDYAINERLYFSLEPTLRYFKDPFYNSLAEMERPWSAGLKFGVKYGLGNKKN